MTNRYAGFAAKTLAALGITQAAETEGESTETIVTTGEGEGEEKPDEAAAAEAAEAEAVEAEASVAAAITLAATESAAKATAAANARWAGVLGSEEAKGRTAQAATLLGNTSLDAAAIKTALAAFPKEAAAGFAARMADVKNPEVTAGASDSDPKADNHGWGKAAAKVTRTKAAK